MANWVDCTLKKPLKLSDMIKMIASLSGFLNRKNDGELEPQTMWISTRNMYDVNWYFLM